MIFEPNSYIGVFNRYKVIGVHGRIKSGKDTVVDMMMNRFAEYIDFAVKKTSFAEPLKRVCTDILGLTQEQVHSQEQKAMFNSFWGMTNRRILQKIGTEAMRRGFHPDVWTKLAELKVKDTPSINYIFSDVRFVNEAEMIRNCGGIIIQVCRESVEPPKGLRWMLHCIKQWTKGHFILREHISERPLPDELIDYKIDNNGTINELSVAVDCFLKQDYNQIAFKRIKDDLKGNTVR